MATEQQSQSAFGTVNRLRGKIFEYLSLGASVIGLVALGILLTYVAIDAFDLTGASPEWLLTYYLTLVVPVIGFCLYSARDATVTRRVLGFLGGGLVGTAAVFTAVEALLGPIPSLNWQLLYLFAVVVPTTGYAAIAAFQQPVGRVGFGITGRLMAGIGTGLALTILFVVFDIRLWFLAYTLGVLPAVAVYGLGRYLADARITTLAVPVGFLGLVAAAVLRNMLALYPVDWILYAWAVAVPLAGLTAIVSSQRYHRRQAIGLGLAVVFVAVGGGLLIGSLGGPIGTAIIVLATTSMATMLYVARVVATSEGRLGVLFPAVLIGGVVVGATVVEAFGFPMPDPWLTVDYVTSAPSTQTPRDAGLYPAIVGSVIVIAIVAVLSFVLGVGTATFLEEYTANSGPTGALARIIQINIANLAAVPSVVYGLLGLGLFANFLGFGLGTVITAGVTLSLLILPITIVSAQEAIRAVPDELRRGSYAVGATRWQTTKNVVLPEALPGILTGTILSLGRAIGETAPLIMIGAATTVFNPPSGLFSTVSAMPMQIYAWASFPQDPFRYGVVAAGVVTLLTVLIGMNAAAILIRNRAESDT